MRKIFMRKNLLVAVLAGVLCFVLSDAVRAETAVVPQSRAQMALSFAPLVETAAPAVVNIYTKRVVRERLRMISPFFNDPFFGRFFGGGALGPEQERVDTSLGSGVILDEDGLVATNYHVVKEASAITVVLSDGREFEAEKILEDEKTDLAMLRIQGKGMRFAALPLTDSDEARVGDVVLAIGNPFGVGQTVTSGIISALARTGVGVSDYGFFIQTDAAINPGNSGGALLDMQGRLLGINSAIYSRDGGSLGIGFAIPANMVRAVMVAAQNGGRLVHPWTGVNTQNVTADLAEGLGLPSPQGALITKVAPASPAEKAGLRAGDVITAVDGKPVRDSYAVRFRLATKPLGAQVALTVRRMKKDMTLVLVTAEPPEVPPRQRTTLEGSSPLSGAVVVNISPAVREELGALERDTGVVVENAGEGRARRMGLARGDIVLEVNGAAIKDVKTLVAAVKAPAQTWRIQVLRGGRVLSIVVAG